MATARPQLSAVSHTPRVIGQAPLRMLQGSSRIGPVVKHQFEGSVDEFDLDLQKNGRGRIIFLGDGTEVLTEGDEEEGD